MVHSVYSTSAIFHILAPVIQSEKRGVSMANLKSPPLNRPERDQRQFEERLPLQYRRLLTVKEAAEILGMKVSTIRAWLYQRRFPVVRCGRSIRIPGQAVAEFIELHTTPAREDHHAR